MSTLKIISSSLKNGLVEDNYEISTTPALQDRSPDNLVRLIIRGLRNTLTKESFQINESILDDDSLQYGSFSLGSFELTDNNNSTPHWNFNFNQFILSVPNGRTVTSFTGLSNMRIEITAPSSYTILKSTNERMFINKGDIIIVSCSAYIDVENPVNSLITSSKMDYIALTNDVNTTFVFTLFMNAMVIYDDDKFEIKDSINFPHDSFPEIKFNSFSTDSVNTIISILKDSYQLVGVDDNNSNGSVSSSDTFPELAKILAVYINGSQVTIDETYRTLLNMIDLGFIQIRKI
jgi:hypothetical protein